MKYLRIFSLILSVLMTTAILGGCGEKCYIPDKKIEGSNLYVKKVDNIPENFIFGMDASSVLSEEASGVKYYNFDGEEHDVFKTLAESGVNYIRVRVWNNPFDGDNNGYGGGNCTIDTAVEIGKRATKYGMKLLLNFHYSDFWADPGKQMVPLEWKDMKYNVIDTPGFLTSSQVRSSLSPISTISFAILSFGSIFPLNGLAGKPSLVSFSAISRVRLVLDT